MRDIIDIYKNIMEVNNYGPYKSDKTGQNLFSTKEEKLLASNANIKLGNYVVKEIEEGDLKTIGLESNSEIIGYISFTNDVIFRNMYPVLVENTIFVKIVFRNKGIGKILIDYILDHECHYFLSSDSHSLENKFLWKSLFNNRSQYNFYIYYNDHVYTVKDPEEFWDDENGVTRILVTTLKIDRAGPMPPEVYNEI